MTALDTSAVAFTYAAHTNTHTVSLLLCMAAKNNHVFSFFFTLKLVF